MVGLTAPAGQSLGGAVGSAGTAGSAGIGSPLQGQEWSEILSRLIAGQNLSLEEAGAALDDILEGSVPDAVIAAFVTALRVKGETTEEMTGFVRAMRARALRVPLEGVVHDDLVDTCGTGGDRSGSINVSTIAAFVVAGAGVPVCKHGGRAASSVAGSADVLEALGVRTDLSPEGVATCIRQAGIGFCLAPLFHPAMRHAVPVRKALKVATVFNFLGPLANPSLLRRQVVGVSDPAMADVMIGVLEANGALHAMVVYGHDGLDELSTGAPSTIVETRLDESGSAHIRRVYEVDASQLGLRRVDAAQLRGGTAEQNAEHARRVLAGEHGPHRDIVQLNAAAGLVVAGRASDLAEGIELAGAALDSGSAASSLARLVEISVTATP